MNDNQNVYPLLILICLYLATTHKSLAQQKPNVEKTIRTLSLNDKERLVVGSEMEKAWNGGDQETAVGETADKVPGAAGTSLPVKLLGHKKIVFADGPAGVRINPKRPGEPDQEYYATAFPIATMLASSFNKDLLYEVGTRFGDEAKEFGVDILLAPAMNIHRNPLGGRNFEYYSEDPLLSGKLGTAFTKGVQSNGVGVSIKHFVANNQETNRSRINAIIGERALREIYLRGFEIAVKNSDPWTVMSAYNKINGEYAAESKALLTTVLRDEWGFNGFVMTDWFAGEDIIAQLKAGNDLLMPGEPKFKGKIVEAVKRGELKESDLNQNIRSILNIYKKTPTFLNYKPSGKPNLKLSQTTAEKAAIEGSVLLKNNNQTLPLSNSVKAGLFGVASYETIAVGTGSGNVNMKRTISIAEGLQSEGQISEGLQKTYANYLRDYKANTPEKEWYFGPDKLIPEKKWDTSQLDNLAKRTEIGILTINRTSGEFYDREQGHDFYLSKEEQNLLKSIAEAYHKQDKKCVVILNIGGVIETESWKDYADAILLAWQPGQEGGRAVAKLLYGRRNPSGKLPMTFPKQYTDHYSSRNFPGKELEDNPYPNPLKGVKSEVIYEEDLFVGYRYFDTFNIPVSFPFGFGLSYTDFDLKNLKVNSSNNGNLSLSCDIENTGNMRGKEVGQVYISAPNGKLKKPRIELRAFSKTDLLNPGQVQHMDFKLSPKDYASYSKKQNAWVLEPGRYTVHIGNSSKNLILKGSFQIDELQIVEKTKADLEPSRAIEKLNLNTK